MRHGFSVNKYNGRIAPFDTVYNFFVGFFVCILKKKNFFWCILFWEQGYWCILFSFLFAFKNLIILNLNVTVFFSYPLSSPVE